MPSIRMDKKIFPFFNSVKSPITAAGTSASFHNFGYESMCLEITGADSIKLTIEGCSNIQNADETTKEDSECEWTPIAAINASSFTLAKVIEAKGVYYLSISGLSRVRIVVTEISGAATIIGTAGAM